MIETFNELFEAFEYIENFLFNNKTEYFKSELYKTSDNRWRVGIVTEQQMELDF